jgi:CO/xanthine dehydrogenase Mo-binding subunit
MDIYNVVGQSVQRLEAEDKVTGRARYTDDYDIPGLLHVRMLISPYAHAKIKSIDYGEAQRAPGVRAVLTGQYFPHLTGESIVDRPPIAIDKVRYHGEPVAVVVADSEAEAEKAVYLIKVAYEPLPVVNTPIEGIKKNAVLIHEKLGEYKVAAGFYPEANTNITNRTKIRKGNLIKGFEESEVIAEANFFLPPSDHTAMETRSARAEIKPDGNVIIYASSQSPFS